MLLICMCASGYVCIMLECVYWEWWRTKPKERFSFYFLNGDVVFARGESDNHVQNRREERSGAIFEENLISISCTYSSYGWRSDRATSVEWADEN